MAKKHNKNLKKFYDSVYQKGERQHYTKLVLATPGVTPEKKAILGSLQWKGKRVLDVGCGTGELAYLIARRGAQEVFGIDYSKAAIHEARSLHSHPVLSYGSVDIRHVRGRYDVIVFVGTLEHLDHPLRLLQKAKRLLSLHGSILVSCPNWSNVRGYILITLKELFDASITLADLHYLTPYDFEKFAVRLKMNVEWSTIEQEWGHGKKMIADLRRRLPKVLPPAKNFSRSSIDRLLRWLDRNIVPLEKNALWTGAVGIYHFSREKR